MPNRDIVEEARERFRKTVDAQYDERMQCLQDRRFYSVTGAQWEGDYERQFQNKPRMEVNKTQLGVQRIINEYRNNRITVDFVSKDGDSDDDMASVCDGLYRADEEASASDEAYDNAFEEAVGGGFGSWRLREVYEDEYDPENEYQRICIEPIFDADARVFFDNDAKRQDKRDAKFCFVLTSMSPEEFKDTYNMLPSSWDNPITESEYDWNSRNVVNVMEYFVVENAKEKILIYEDVFGEEHSFKESELEDEDLMSRIEGTGMVLVRERTIKQKKVRKYLLSGSHVLEDNGYLPGSEIPIIPVYGKRWYVDGIERMQGHVRLVKDAQRLKNMQISKLAELSAISPNEKPIMPAEMVAGHEQIWREDNIKNYPFLPINPLMDADGRMVAAGPTASVKPPQVQPATAALIQLTEQDIQDLLGRAEAGEELRSNVSGKAVELVQNRLDMQTFIYMSNMAKAMKRSGEVWLSMARELLVEPKRKMKTIDRSGDVGSVELSQPIYSEKGELEYKNDISKAKYDVIVDVGPSTQTKRQAVVRTITGLLQMIPQQHPTFGDLLYLAVLNLEGEGLDDIRKSARRDLVRSGRVEPTEEEQKELAQEAQMRQPTPEHQFILASAQNEQAKAQKAQADTALTAAKVQSEQAKTLETLSEIDAAERRQALETAQFISSRQAGIGEGGN